MLPCSGLMQCDGAPVYVSVAVLEFYKAPHVRCTTGWTEQK